jgi:hypothetical protein
MQQMPKSQLSWVRSQHFPLRTADEAVLNKVMKKSKKYRPLIFYLARQLSNDLKRYSADDS